MKMTNRWNRIIYRLWAPIYDGTLNRFFLPGRKKALQSLDLQVGERVLIVGIGTGADLPMLPVDVEVIGVDLSREMLAKARLKLERSPARVKLIQADAQTLLFEPASFDAIILNLILSVIPDGKACLQAAFQVLRPGGRAVIFDKFLPEGKHLSVPRKFINLFSTLLGTDINRRLSDLMADCPCEIIQDEPGIANGLYRVILLRKSESVDGNALFLGRSDRPGPSRPVQDQESQHGKEADNTAGVPQQGGIIIIHDPASQVGTNGKGNAPG
jgi:phosphatidylethanolamine/phosphatidyl-N-methylethanolamine N-methyltransferase